MNLKFFYNGIKGTDKKLQRCSYSIGALRNHPEGTLTIYGRDYKRFSDEVKKEFEVENKSDSMTDYFENDHLIRVKPDHKHYQLVLEAYNKQQIKRQGGKN